MSSQIGTVIGWIIFLIALFLPVPAALLISVIGTYITLFLLPDSKPYAVEKYPEPESIRKILGQEQKECYQVVGEKKIIQ